ncbi:MAG: cobyrinate a,c-diamide synthase [Deltaproteobacteria bacterium]|nr:cobyrinate a,c-diamide synthase [Deltaproteobacteria bacterium]
MADRKRVARIVIAGLGGDSGKTLVSLGLLATFRRAGRRLAAFKKGPDYIDAAWLGWAAGRPARNLDTFLMGDVAVRRSFAAHAADLCLIEGNRGLHDGLDGSGSASTAALARLLRTPVLLVVSVPKVTATAAALVLGCQAFDPRVRIGGVILNRVAGERHERVCRDAIERACGIPVVGAIPRLDDDLLPGRHLGLVTPAEHPRLAVIEDRLVELISRYVDVARIAAIAESARPFALPRPAARRPTRRRGRVRVGCFDDSAFTFYYPENLEALVRAGARIERVSAVRDPVLPPLDLLYLGGGFPETHAAALCANHSLRESVRAAAEAGLPIYAECGGLMYLSESIRVGGVDYPMAGVLPLAIEVGTKPAGHGYVEVSVDSENPFFPVGTAFKGHEFHYSRIVAGQDLVASAYAVVRGQGCFGRARNPDRVPHLPRGGHAGEAGASPREQRDGIVYRNVLASYAHLHAGGLPEWGDRLCRSALRFRRRGERATRVKRWPQARPRPRPAAAP